MIKRNFFTIVELLVVISIIAVLAGMLIGGLGGATEQSNKAATKADLMKLEMALEQYKQENGSYPWLTTASTNLNNSATTELQTLLSYESFTTRVSGAQIEAIDAWDNNIYYLPSTYTGGTYSTTSTPPAVEISTTLPGVYYNPQSFQLISAGADGDIMTPNDNVYNFDKKN